MSFRTVHEKKKKKLMGAAEEKMRRGGTNLGPTPTAAGENAVGNQEPKTVEHLQSHWQARLERHVPSRGGKKKGSKARRWRRPPT